MFEPDEHSYSDRFNELVRHYFDDVENTRDANEDLNTDKYKTALNKVHDMYVEFKALTEVASDERDSWNLDSSFVDVVMNQIEVLAQISNEAEFEIARDGVHKAVQIISQHVEHPGHFEDLSALLANEAEALFAIAEMFEDPKFRDKSVEIVSPSVLKSSVKGLHNLSQQLDIEAKAASLPGFNPRMKH